MDRDVLLSDVCQIWTGVTDRERTSYCFGSQRMAYIFNVVLLFVLIIVFIINMLLIYKSSGNTN